MDAGLFDVLHHRADEDVALPIAHGIDVHLDRAFEESVDQDRMLALLNERRKAGSPAMGMVLTFLVVTDEGDHYDALRVARRT